MKQDVKWEIKYYVKGLHNFEVRTGNLDFEGFYTLSGSSPVFCPIPVPYPGMINVHTSLGDTNIWNLIMYHSKCNSSLHSFI